MRPNIRYLLAGIVVGIGLVIGVINYGNADSYSCEKVAIQAEVGDDYWGYLQKHCKGNLERAANDVVKFYGSTLMPGRVIYLPTSDECELQWVKMANGSEYVYESCPS